MNAEKICVHDYGELWVGKKVFVSAIVEVWGLVVETMRVWRWGDKRWSGKGTGTYQAVSRRAEVEMFWEKGVWVARDWGAKVMPEEGELESNDCNCLGWFGRRLRLLSPPPPWKKTTVVGSFEVGPELLAVPMAASTCGRLCLSWLIDAAARSSPHRDSSGEVGVGRGKFSPVLSPAVVSPFLS